VRPGARFRFSLTPPDAIPTFVVLRISVR